MKTSSNQCLCPKLEEIKVDMKTSSNQFLCPKLEEIKKYLTYKDVWIKDILNQGYNVRKVISEVYASFVLQCSVSGRECKHKTDVTAWYGIHFSHKKIN